MDYIYRELLAKLESNFASNQPKGYILAGIVGCGKTTLIEKLIEKLEGKYQIFSMSGDDVIFRRQVAEDTNYILNFVKSNTNKRALVFVDEVQKTEEVFDALKIAFDKGKISFIVSGSNPSYLSTIAKKRLQRRAEQIFMLPLSLSEILISKGVLKDFTLDIFENILWKLNSIKELKLPKLDLSNKIDPIVKDFFLFGGLPLSHIAKTEEQKLKEIRLTVERGFDLMSTDNSMTNETVKTELAILNSKEFTYKNVLTKTRLKKRDLVNKVIDSLINHGYLVRKKPMLLPDNKSSYLSVFSYIDPGIVTYLTGNRDLTNTIGSQIESYIHARLHYLTQNSPFKSEVGYYKPYTIDSNDKVKYEAGEIDFIFKNGSRIIPIEVKTSTSIGSIKTIILEDVIKKKHCPFGIVIYGGVPNIDRNSKIIYWPYWMT